MKNQRKIWQRAVAMCCVLVILAAMAVGCSGQTSGNKAGPVVDDKTPFKITWLNQNILTEPPKPDNASLKILQEYTNTILDIVWAPSSVMPEKINTSIASGDLPMIIMNLNNKGDVMVNAIRSGMFWEVGPYIKDYPNLNKFNKQVLETTSIDGKIYGLPRWRYLVEDGFVYRKDWLDVLNMKLPTTIDEMYNVIKAFGTQDPDKNGQADTMGIVEYADIRGFRALSSWFGAPNEWDMKDGKFTSAVMTSEYLDTMKFLKKLYDEKLLNQDFAIINRNQRDDYINKGRAGFEITGIDQGERYGDLVKVNPKAVIGIDSRIKGPKGDRQSTSKGYNGVFFFPKSSVKTEAELKRILAFFDKMGDEKMQILFQYGIEGKHYTSQNGKISVTKEQNDLFMKEGYELSDEMVINYKDKITTLPEGLKGKWMSENIKNESIGVFNPAAAFLSDTYAKKGSELDTIIKDARTKFIMGKIDEAGWKQELDKWLKTGGDAMTKEYNEQYQKFGKK